MAKNPSFNYNNPIRTQLQARLSRTNNDKQLIEGIKGSQARGNENQPSLSAQQARGQFVPPAAPSFPKPLDTFGNINSILGSMAKYNHDRIYASTYVGKNQFNGFMNGQPQQYSMNIGAPRTAGAFQASYSNINTNNLFSSANQQSPLRPSNGLSTSAFFSTMSAGIINNQQTVEAARSAGQDKLVAALNSLGKKLEETSRGNGGGGGNDGGGGGLGDFLQNLGRKDRLGFRGGIAGQLLQTSGQLINSGIDAYLNYQTQMATAPVQTYSNIAELKGFQQRRFLRDFSDFSPESQVLRNKFLRYDQTDITSRIDKIAKETTQKQDIAETQATIKQSFAGILGSVAQGAIMGAGTGAAIGAITGPGALATAGVGAITGGLAALASEFAGSFNNPVLMRNQKVFGDLYLKNRTAFDTQNIMQNTQSMENAVLQNSQIDIAVQREYQKTLNPRIQAGRRGRYLDVFGELNQLTNVMGYNTARIDPLTGQVMDQSAQLQNMAGALYQPGQAPRNFAQSLIKMGVQPGSAEAEALIGQFANIGGAGAGTPKPKDFQSFEKIRKMAESGRGPADLLLGQAGILGRLSGGVTAEQNIKKLEEVLSRAVAIGMDNSELGSAFVENVANMSAQMKSGDVNAMAALVQKMQAAGGGQLVDFQRMQRSISGFDAQRQQNLGVKTYARENVANVINKYVESGVLSGTDASTALTTISEMGVKDLAGLQGAAQKYSKAKTEKERFAAVRNVSPALRNFMLTLDPEQIRKMGTKGFVSNIQNAFGAAAAGMTPEQFKEEFGVSPSDISQANQKTRVRIAQRFHSFAGGEAGGAMDVLRMFGLEDIGGAPVYDKKRIEEQERRGDTSAKEAGSKAALGLGARGPGSMGGELRRLSATMISDPKAREQYEALISKTGLSNEQKAQLPKILEDYYNPLSPKSKDRDKVVGADAEIIKKLNLTLEQAQGAGDIKSVAERSQGTIVDNAQAASIGSAFADAFFERMGQKAPGFSEKMAEIFSVNKSTGN